MKCRRKHCFYVQKPPKMKQLVDGIVVYIAHRIWDGSAGTDWTAIYQMFEEHLSTQCNVIFGGTFRVMVLVVNINLSYRLTSEHLCRRYRPGEVGYLFHLSPSSSSTTYSYPASPSSLADSEPELRQTQMARYFIQLRVFDGGRMRINGQRAC